MKTSYDIREVIERHLKGYDFQLFISSQRGVHFCTLSVSASEREFMTAFDVYIEVMRFKPFPNPNKDTYNKAFKSYSLESKEEFFQFLFGESMRFHPNR